MNIWVNRDTKRFLLSLSAVWAAFFLMLALAAWPLGRAAALRLALLALLAAGAMGAVCLRYFARQNAILERAVSRIEAYLAGDGSARIDCDEEGELYRLFHAVNSLAAILNAHADNEQREKVFLRNTISDISHQLKTPLAALNVYNGLLQQEAEGEAKRFAVLSERELDRIETLVQNLLKITRLDAGSIALDREEQRVADMMRDVQLHFAYRAGQEQKRIVLSGPEDVSLLCDRDWVIEAVGNIVKNALDHTQAGDTIRVEWRALSSAVQIAIQDNGSGIHPEDLPHIFKRFYRSRFSKDTQGIGLGLPLAKAIVEAHNGAIEVDSALGRGTAFTINFLIPTKL